MGVCGIGCTRVRRSRWIGRCDMRSQWGPPKGLSTCIMGAIRDLGGAAKGLEYLHHGCDRPVIHRDVKKSNILLDEQLKPKIADFGLAKVVQPNRVRDSTHIIAGTHGYMALEYAYTSKVNEKSDVYSFGVVLMELVSERGLSSQSSERTKT
ncbi:hypothetical protein ACSBR2_019018 [Camellia fascicularis]